MIPSDLDPDLVDSEGNNLLEEIDKAMAVHILARLKSGEASAQEMEAVRKYLTYKGYRGPSPAAVKKTGVEDPRGSLEGIPAHVLASFYE